MIARYNRIQIFRAFFALVLGAMGFYLAWLFFRYVPAWVTSRFGHPLSSRAAEGVAALALLAASVSGYRVWRSHGGLYSYHESALYHNLEPVSGGSVMISMYAHRVTAIAFLLSQVFMGGPLQVLRARTLLASLLPSDATTEAKVAHALQTLRTANKWQGLSDYPAMRTEILYLAQMGLIDFSAHKGAPRIKAR